MKTSFVIDRSTWRCGHNGFHRHGKGESELLNEYGHKCFLGSISADCGLGDLIFEITSPRGIKGITNDEVVSSIPFLCFIDTDGDLADSDFADRAMSINDNPGLTDIQRERQLERLAEKYGLRIEFVGEYDNENLA